MHRWTDKPPEQEQAFRANRRRVRGTRSKRLQRQRSERVERSFAHVCETGGARRTWLCGLEKINKRYRIQAAARNLGLLMLRLFGIGKPRALQGAFSPLGNALPVLVAAKMRLWHTLHVLQPFGRQAIPHFALVNQSALAI